MRTPALQRLLDQPAKLHADDAKLERIIGRPADVVEVLAAGAGPGVWVDAYEVRSRRSEEGVLLLFMEGQAFIRVILVGMSAAADIIYLTLTLTELDNDDDDNDNVDDDNDDDIHGDDDRGNQKSM
jgi:hypothetical protein